MCTSQRDTVKIAMMQMRVIPGAPEKNLAHAEALLDEVCRTEQPDFALFPETCDLGWAAAEAPALAAPVPHGAVCRAWQALAQRCGVHIVAGLTERAGPRLYNAAVCISPAGEVLAHHRKINVLQDAEALYEPGGRLELAETPFGRVGISICADNFPDCTVLLQAMGRMGARLILSPAAWAVPPDFDPEKTPYGGLWASSYGPMSRLYAMPIVGVSNVGRLTGGPWAGYHAIGNSLAFDAEGHEAARLPFGPDAEAVRVIELALPGPIARGTGFAEALRVRACRAT